ncbi:MAG TPA: hypothetical protein VFR97_12715 [Capillimicrobium sp.]|nr:hypothetical protein [Capillimicrobium sp.]
MDTSRVQLGLLLKRLVVGFWTMFFSLVALTNLVNLLDELGAFDWRFLDSGNYGYLRSVVDVYEVGPAVTKVLLAGAFSIELVAAVVFWRALLALGRDARGGRRALLAVCFGTFVWIAFIFMTELFTAYESESVFRELLTLTIATALALVLVPDDAGGTAHG